MTDSKSVENSSPLGSFADVCRITPDENGSFVMSLRFGGDLVVRSTSEYRYLFDHDTDFHAIT